MSTITRRENLPKLPFRRYRPVPKMIRAVQLCEPEDIRGSYDGQETFHGEPGDWRIFYGTNPDGSQAVSICNGDIFSQIYEHVEGDTYRKKTSYTIEAAQLQQPLDIVTLEGPAHSEAGGWLLVGTQGELYFNSDEYFRRSYVIADKNEP